MQENFPTKSYDNIKDLTILLQKHFTAENHDNFKWLLLKDYHMKFLLKKDFSQAFTASYIAILSKLLDSIRPNLFTEKWQELLFDNIFLQGIHHEAFLLLSDRLRKK